MFGFIKLINWSHQLHMQATGAAFACVDFLQLRRTSRALVIAKTNSVMVWASFDSPVAERIRCECHLITSIARRWFAVLTEGARSIGSSGSSRSFGSFDLEDHRFCRAALVWEENDFQHLIKIIWTWILISALMVAIDQRMVNTDRRRLVWIGLSGSRTSRPGERVLRRTSGVLRLHTVKLADWMYKKKRFFRFVTSRLLEFRFKVSATEYPLRTQLPNELLQSAHSGGTFPHVVRKTN